MNRVSAIIVNHDSPEETAACCKSLLKGSLQPHEILIVDNGRGSEELSSLSAAEKSITYFQGIENQGFGAAVNYGAAQARGDSLLISNPDILYDAACLETLAGFLEKSESHGAVGPRTVFPDGSPQFTARRFPSMRTFFFHRTSLLSKLFPGNPMTRQYLEGTKSSDSPAAVDWLAASSILVRRTAFERINGFDEDYFLFMEDVDFCKRLWETGEYEVHFHPGATAVHTLGVSNDPSIKVIRHRHNSIRTYIRKHFHKYSWPMRRLALLAATFREKTLIWRKRRKKS